MRISKVAEALFRILLCSLAFVAPLHAKQESATTAIEDARAILVASNFQQTVDAMFTQLIPVMESGFIGQIAQINGGDKLVRRIESSYPGGTKGFGKRFGELMLAGMRAKYSYMIERAAQQYVAEIRPDQLAAIRAFMQSPSGRSMTAAQPKMQREMSSAGQAVGRTVGEEAATQLMAEADRYLGAGK